MNRPLVLVAALAAIGALSVPNVAPAQSGYYGAGASLVRCESTANRTQLCRVDTRGGVRLVDQESHTPCIHGRTWGYDTGGIWVAGGCRARFEVGGAYASRDRYGTYPYAGDPRYPGYGDRYRDPRYTDPYAPRTGYYGDTRYRSAVYGGSSTYRSGIYGGSTYRTSPYGSGYYGGGGYTGSAYGSDGRYGRDGYGSDGYYRGDGFGAAYGNPIAAILGAVLGSGDYDRRYYSGREPRVFRCESIDGAPRFCRLPFAASRIDIRRQLSDSPCSHGYSWGWQRDGVWVERGCRAEFVVY